MLRPLVVLAALGPLICCTTQAHAVAKPQQLEARTGPTVRQQGGARKAQGLGARISARATRLVGVSSLRQVDRSVPDDCTGVVRIAYESVGIELMAGAGRPGSNGVTHIYLHAQRLGAVHKGRPKPGDLVFFRETYDRDRDGRRDDGLTHVGIVERVAPDGSVTFVHRGSKGVARAKMDLRQPRLHRARGGGAVVNDYLRRASRGSRPYLTGELFAGFASPGLLARAATVSPSR